MFRVTPPIIPFVDGPYRCANDLQDIRIALRPYEQQSDRLFSDAVFDAEERWRPATKPDLLIAF